MTLYDWFLKWFYSIFSYWQENIIGVSMKESNMLSSIIQETFQRKIIYF